MRCVVRCRQYGTETADPQAFALMSVCLSGLALEWLSDVIKGTGVEIWLVWGGTQEHGRLKERLANIYTGKSNILSAWSWTFFVS